MPDFPDTLIYLQLIHETIYQKHESRPPDKCVIDFFLISQPKHRLWSLIADPGVVSSIIARPHTFEEIGTFYGHSPPSADSRRAVVSCKQKKYYVH